MNSEQISRLCADRKVLDIGCGQNKFPDSTGIDFASNACADFRHDLNTFPYPCESNEFDVLLLRNVIEHLSDIVGLMNEIHRVGKPGSDVVITTPHFSSLYSYQDPTHVRHLALDSMDYFTADTRHSNFYTSSRFVMVGKGIDFGKSFPLSHIARMIFALSARKYEKHYAFIFPANSLWFHLRVDK